MLSVELEPFGFWGASWVLHRFSDRLLRLKLAADEDSLRDSFGCAGRTSLLWALVTFTFIPFRCFAIGGKFTRGFVLSRPRWLPSNSENFGLWRFDSLEQYYAESSSGDDSSLLALVIRALRPGFVFLAGCCCFGVISFGSAPRLFLALSASSFGESSDSGRVDGGFD